MSLNCADVNNILNCGKGKKQIHSLKFQGCFLFVLLLFSFLLLARLFLRDSSKHFCCVVDKAVQNLRIEFRNSTFMKCFFEA